jgi:hypothetical protein
VTDLQDLICDRLVGSRISRDWAEGPLHIAARVLVPGFHLARSGHNRRSSQLVSTLKWPRLFTFAFHGANAALAEEEDRRTLALTLFRTFAPRAKPMRVPTRRNAETAARLALRVHPLVCPGPCPLHQAMTDLVNDFLADRPFRTKLKACHSLLGSCPAHTGPVRAAVKLASPPAHHALTAYRHLLVALAGHQVPMFGGDSTRESARTEAKVRGVQGAVEICLEAARLLGL